MDNFAFAVHRVCTYVGTCRYAIYKKKERGFEAFGELLRLLSVVVGLLVSVGSGCWVWFLVFRRRTGSLTLGPTLTLSRDEKI